MSVTDVIFVQRGRVPFFFGGNQICMSILNKTHFFYTSRTQFKNISYLCTRKEVTEMLQVILFILFIYAVVKIAPKGSGAGNCLTDDD